MNASNPRKLVLSILACSVLGCAARAGDAEEHGVQRSELSDFTDFRPWAREIPGLAPEVLPQFVAITFDDNFGAEGVNWANDLYRSLENPSGADTAGTFDGTQVRTTFFSNTDALWNGGVPEAWAASVVDGHELANHTRDHDTDESFTFEQWEDEIGTCTDQLSDPESGLGVSRDQVLGFRTPYLRFNDATFQVLVDQGLAYDSSIQGCRAPEEDGKNCSFPYTLDTGSPDNQALMATFPGEPEIAPHPGLWEVPIAALVVPPDEVATQYGFTPGLRTRISGSDPALTGRPNYYDDASHKIAPLDITLFYDAKMTGDEVFATLAYNYDLHRTGNRAPFVFVAHTHVYAENWNGNSPQADLAARRGAIEDFIAYALSHAETRMRPLRDVIAWMRAPVSLTGQPPATGGASSGGASGVGGSSGSSGGTTETGGSSSGGSTSGDAIDTPSDTEAGCSCHAAGAPGGSTSGAFYVGALCVAALWVRRRTITAVDG